MLLDQNKKYAGLDVYLSVWYCSLELVVAYFYGPLAMLLYLLVPLVFDLFI